MYEHKETILIPNDNWEHCSICAILYKRFFCHVDLLISDCAAAPNAYLCSIEEVSVQNNNEVQMHSHKANIQTNLASSKASET